ncbi:uncharacterized protein CDAR_2591 [Caerostris darwini]|uniref:Uncharacterized protein n=1 Tax=Caerostris darwini TaxID=1538125 RepID=A0AAV4MYQ5_9ARAC|nr:uncharacterized protein CDAR_2591 [Caerostris darwini]
MTDAATAIRALLEPQAGTTHPSMGCFIGKHKITWDNTSLKIQNLGYMIVSWETLQFDLVPKNPVRFFPDQRRGLPVECLSCAADRASVRTDRFGGQLTADSELARTKGIRLSN